jgi:hypothetical protein
MRLVTTVFLVHLVASSFCLPSPFQSNGQPYISVPDLYEGLRLDEVPTTFEEGLVLSRSNETRYGYQFGRPLDSVIRVLNSPLKFLIVPLFGEMANNTVGFQHWGILVSDEMPLLNGTMVEPGTVIPAITDGILFELRNSENTGLIYLDVKRWATYWWRPMMVRYLGPMNHTDIEMVNIGRAYIQHVGREGFHNIYRNCQIFTTWYAKALWGQPALPRTTDQTWGKFWWWFRDWGSTFKYGWRRFGNFLGANNELDELDSSIEFVPMEELLEYSSATAGGDQDCTSCNNST